MLRNLRERMESEKGFTLIELLVVILIIGILAAIALPAFLGQQKKGQDGEAKSNARNLVTHVESCFAESQDYAACNTATELPNTGLDVVDAAPAAGEVAVTAAGTNTYTVTATSKAETSGTNHSFTITKGADGVSTRGCSPGGEGGCKTGGTW